MAFTENLSQFFRTADFAVEAAYTPEGGSAATIHGIFDAEYLAVDGEGNVAVASSQPVFHCRTSDVVDPYGGTLVVAGVTYDIVEFKPDGTGTTMLVLEDAS